MAAAAAAAPPYPQIFEKGDEVFYVRGSDPPLDGVVQKVHLEDEVPYYTVLIAVTGREKNTDRQHLRHKGAKVPTRNRERGGPEGGGLVAVKAYRYDDAPFLLSDAGGVGGQRGCCRGGSFPWNGGDPTPYSIQQ